MEYLSRIKAIQSRLHEEKIGIALVTEPVHTGYLCDICPVWGPCWIVIPVEGAAVCLCPEEDKSLAQTSNDVLKFYFYNAYDLKRGIDPTEELLKGFLYVSRNWNTGKIAVGIEKSTVSHSLFFALCAGVRHAEFKDIGPIFQTLRRRKSKSEIEAIERSACVAAAGQEAIRKGLKIGTTEADLLAVARYAMERKAGHPITLHADLLSGSRTLSVGGTATRRKIEKNDLIIADLSPCVNGYFADVTRTFVIGRPTNEQKKIFEAVKRAKEAAASMLAPGVACCEVERAARRVIKKSGFERFILHHAGHQIGRENFELPAFVPYSKDVLEEGMVMAVEIGVYIPGIGGVRMEDDYLITESASRLLSNCPWKWALR